MNMIFLCVDIRHPGSGDSARHPLVRLVCEHYVNTEEAGNSEGADTTPKNILRMDTFYWIG